MSAKVHVVHGGVSVLFVLCFGLFLSPPVAAGAAARCVSEAWFAASSSPAPDEADTPSLQDIIDEQQRQLRRTRMLVAAVALLSALLVVFSNILFSIVRRRTQALDMKKNMDSISKNFYSNMTHELRTPLSVIIGQARLLSSGETDEQRRRDLHSIVGLGNLMLQQVDRMAQASDEGAGDSGEQWRRDDLVAFVKVVTEGLLGLAVSRKITLSCTTSDDRIVMNFIPYYMRTVLSNIISNAIRYTPAGGRVLVSLERQAGRVLIKVADNGVGIPSDELQYIYEPRFRARNVPGTTGQGLGLSLVRPMVATMKGTIAVHSVEHLGTCFFLRFPLKATDYLERVEGNPNEEDTKNPRPFNRKNTPTTDSPDSPDQPDLPDSPKPRLLVAEDSREMADYIAGLFASDYVVRLAADGEEAFRRAQTFEPDVLITDLMLKQLNGYDLCRKLRADSHLASMVVIMISARDGVDDRLEAFRAGVDLYLSKPFDERLLLESTGRLLRKAREADVSRGRKAIGQTNPPRKGTDSPASPASPDLPDSPDSPSTPSLERTRVLVARLDACIQANLSDPTYNSTRLAEQMCLSKRQLNRRVKEAVGIDTFSYIRHLRLRLAKQLLAETDLPVSEIFVRCGYETLSYFSRLFRQEVGCTPSEYRKRRTS